MILPLSDAEQNQLWTLQKQRRDEAGYVKVTVLLLDKGRTVARIAEALGLDDGPDATPNSIRSKGWTGTWPPTSTATGVYSLVLNWPTCTRK